MTMKPVKLAVTTIADRQLRFFLVDGDNNFYNSDNIQMKGCQPLFLGCDVLQGLTLSNKNKYRIHARFAKEGLATKLVFTGCRIDGLRKGDKAYFYSVYGLFRAVFEYHPFSLQHQCLQQLTDLWMQICPAGSQPQLDVAYEVSMQNLVLHEDLPPGASKFHDECEISNDRPLAVSTHTTKKSPILGIGPSVVCGQETAAGNVSAQNDRTSCRGCLRCTSSKTIVCTQDFGTQTDESTKAACPQQTVLPETVCKVCRHRTKMIEKEKAEIDSGYDSVKKSKPQTFVEGDTSSAEGSGLRKTSVAGQVVIADVTDFLTKDDDNVRVQSEQVSTPLLLNGPNSITILNSSFLDDHAGEILSEINQIGDSSKCAEQKADEVHVLGKFVSPLDEAGKVCGVSNTYQVPSSWEIPFASHAFQQIDQGATTSTLSCDTALPMDVTENVPGLPQIQNYLGQGQVQLPKYVQGRNSLCVEADLASVLSGTESSVAWSNVQVVTDSKKACLHPGISRINSRSAVLDTASPNELQAEEGHQNFSQPVCADAVGCVLNWMEEINKLKMLQLSQRVNTASDSLGPGYGNDMNTASAMETSHLQDIQLEMIQVVLDFLLHCMEVVSSSSDVSTISEMLMLVLSSAENSPKFAAAAQEWLVVPPLKLSALTVFGAWLGDEFHRFEPAISQRVTAFKKNHISNISDLPPAADMIGELFPLCMVVLASGWIGLKDLQMAEATERDHCYTSRGAALSAFQHHNRNLYPLIQLILELLNNSLVSGIAHVVYCKLRHAS